VNHKIQSSRRARDSISCADFSSIFLPATRMMAFLGWLRPVVAAVDGLDAISCAFDIAVAVGARAQMDFFNPERLRVDRIV